MIPVVSRVLLLLPSGTYKAPDFLDAARRLGVDVIVASETEQTLADAMGDRALVVDLSDPAGSARKIAALRQPAFHIVWPRDDVVVAADDLGWPVVVKPISLSASRGVIRADNPAEAEAAAARVRGILDGDGHSPEEPILVEQYVPGEEVAVEALLRGAHLEVLAGFDKPDPL